MNEPFSYLARPGGGENPVICSMARPCNRGYYLGMSIAITEDHRALAQTVSDFLAKSQSRAAARALLEGGEAGGPGFWCGSGYGLPEVLVVAEQMGRRRAPGPFVPTVVTSAVLAAAGAGVPAAGLQERLLPGLADGTLLDAFALGGDVTFSDGRASGTAGVVISGHLADVLLWAAGDGVLVTERAAGGVSSAVPANLDPSRRAARVTLRDAPAAP